MKRIASLPLCGVKRVSYAFFLVVSAVSITGCSDPKPDAPKSEPTVVLHGLPIPPTPGGRIVFLPLPAPTRSIAPETRLRVDLSAGTLYVPAGRISTPIQVRIQPYERAAQPLAWGVKPLRVNFLCAGGVECAGKNSFVFDQLSGSAEPVGFSVKFTAPPRRSSGKPAVSMEIVYEVSGADGKFAEMRDVVALDVRMPMERDEQPAADTGDDVEQARTQVVETAPGINKVQLPVRVMFPRKVLPLGPGSMSGGDVTASSADELLPDDLKADTAPVNPGEIDPVRGW